MVDFFVKKSKALTPIDGGLAQLGERLPCTQEVSGSIPLLSTIFFCPYRIKPTFFSSVTY